MSLRTRLNKLEQTQKPTAEIYVVEHLGSGGVQVWAMGHEKKQILSYADYEQFFAKPNRRIVLHLCEGYYEAL